MTSVSDITSTVPAPTPVVATPAVSSATSDVTSQAAATTSNANPITNSRLVNDPLARVLITQYLDSNNQVVSQNPASAVVAYLQNGLTADGFSKQSATA